LTNKIIWTVAGILVAAVAALHLFLSLKERPVQFTTPYQAVLLSNGSVYFGHLQGYGTPHPILFDAFYIVSQTNPDTKQTTNALVKRGKEMHEPDRMYLNPNQILLVEPVGTNSRVTQLIAQSAR
jgi:hypothetical protein